MQISLGGRRARGLATELWAGVADDGYSNSAACGAMFAVTLQLTKAGLERWAEAARVVLEYAAACEEVFRCDAAALEARAQRVSKETFYVIFAILYVRILGDTGTLTTCLGSSRVCDLMSVLWKAAGRALLSRSFPNLERYIWTLSRLLERCSRPKEHTSVVSVETTRRRTRSHGASRGSRVSTRGID